MYMYIYIYIEYHEYPSLPKQPICHRYLHYPSNPDITIIVYTRLRNEYHC